MNKLKCIQVGAGFLLFGVILGAFAAHGLKGTLTQDQLNSFQTGVRYQFYHGLAILLLGVLPKGSLSGKWFRISAWSFIIGIILFSGSIYLLSTKPVHGLQAISFLGPVTPIGGLLFILGWLAVIMGSFSNSKEF